MIVCEKCGIEAPTNYIEFYQSIGLVVLRFQKTVKGNLCKHCINQVFWTFTIVTLLGGWWGIISAILTPLILINNIGRYWQSLKIEAPTPGATSPILTEEAVERIKPHTVDIFTRFSMNEPLDQIAQVIAQKAGVTQGQVLLYIDHLGNTLQTN